MSNTAITTLLVNKSIRTLTLEEIETGSHTKASLIKNGFDGTTWMGSCPKDGKKKACLVLFWRRTNGEFVTVL